jgi:hypothetical protein
MDTVTIELLNAVFEASIEVTAGVDRLSFRARHAKYLERLDRMEQIGRVQVRNNRYFVSVTFLPHCPTHAQRSFWVLQRPSSNI